MGKEISARELHDRLARGEKILPVDVLPPEEYARQHLPGALSACVYEVAFLDRMAELAPDPAAPLVVYDATATTRAAATALDKLARAGYGDVRILAGGLAGWREAGYPLEGSGELSAEPLLRDGIYRIDPGESTLEWIGRSIARRHYGRIAFAGGEIAISGGEPARGELTLDMGTISDLDLENEFYRRMLESHLRSEDFFDVERFPTATFSLGGGKPVAGATPGRANFNLEGSLTIKGITRPVSFPATIAPQEEGSLKAQAAFDIDRTAWNICYGSGKLYEKLGMHLVHDLITIELFIVAR